MYSVVLTCKCVYTSMCVKGTDKIGKRETAEHPWDLLFLNVLDVSRRSWVDGSEQAGIWTDTWFCLESVSALPFTSSLRPTAPRSHSPLNSKGTPLCYSQGPYSRPLPTVCKAQLTSIYKCAVVAADVKVWCQHGSSQKVDSDKEESSTTQR